MCLADVLAQPLRRPACAHRRSRRSRERGDGFERKLGVDHQRPLVRQEHHAVRPRAVRQRVLELVAALRQPVLRRSPPCAPGRRRRAPACWRARSRSEVTCEERSVRFFCALSITASRSCRLCEALDGLLAWWRRIDWPSRWVTASSRSSTARGRARPAGRPALSPIAWSRPAVSACRRDRARRIWRVGPAASAPPDRAQRAHNRQRPAARRPSSAGHRRPRVRASHLDR